VSTNQGCTWRCPDCYPCGDRYLDDQQHKWTPAYQAIRYLLVPGIDRNLISISRVTRAGRRVIFDATYAEIRTKDNKLIAPFASSHNLYTIAASALSATTADDCDLWHLRFRHVAISSLSSIVKKGLVKGLPTFLCTHPGARYSDCTAYVLGERWIERTIQFCPGKSGIRWRADDWSRGWAPTAVP
jgi:hypothetical protein